MIYATLWRLAGHAHGKPVRVDDAKLIWSDGFWFAPEDGRWIEMPLRRLFGLEGEPAPCGVLPDIDDLPPDAITLEGAVYAWQFTCRNGWQVYRAVHPVPVETCMVVIR